MRSIFKRWLKVALIACFILGTNHSIYAAEVRYDYNQNGQLYRTESGKEAYDLNYDSNGNMVGKRKGYSQLQDSTINNVQNAVFAHGDQQLGTHWLKVMEGTANVHYARMQAGSHYYQKITASNMSRDAIAGVKQEIPISVLPHQVLQMKAAVEAKNLTNATIQLLASYRTDKGYTKPEIVRSYSSNTNGFITLSGRGAIVPEHATQAMIYIVIRAEGDQAAGELNIRGVYAMVGHNDNHLINGDFQTVVIGEEPVLWERAMDRVRQAQIQLQRNNRNQYVKVSGSGISKDGFLGVTQKFETKSVSYHVSAAVQIEQLNGAAAEIAVDFYKKDGTWIERQVVRQHPHLTAGKFITVSDTISAPLKADYAALMVGIKGLSNEAAGTIYVDNVQFRLGTFQGILSNFLFDYRSEDDPTVNGWEIIASDSKKVQADLKYMDGKTLHVITAKDLSGWEAAGISQELSVNNITKYHLRVGASVRQLKGAIFMVSVQFYDRNGAPIRFIGFKEPTYDSVTGDEYVTKSTTSYTVPKDAATARVNAVIRSESLSGEGKVLINFIHFMPSGPPPDDPISVPTPPKPPATS